MFRKTLMQAGAAVAMALAVATPSAGDPPHVLGGHLPTASAIGKLHQMPPHNFRGTPPSFHGTLPRPPIHRAPPPGHPIARPGHDLGRFNGHDFGHFTAMERAHWQHGQWHHIRHRGHFGWWWLVDGFWFYYPAPIYPYPVYIGSADYYDYDSEYGTPDYYWYYCADPEGYYPYVTDCNVAWEPVPPTPGIE